MAIYLTSEKLTKHYNESKELGRCNNELLQCFQLIAENFIKTFKADVESMDTRSCISYAVTEAWIKWDKYNPEKSKNIFAFYTEIISNDLKVYYNYLTRPNKRNVSISLFEEKCPER